MYLRHDSPPDVTTLYLPGLRLGEVRTARDHVASALRDEDPDTCSTATLLTSELATNALVHGDVANANAACPRTGVLALARPFHVTVELFDREVCVLVCGGGSRNRVVPQRPRSWDDLTGRGLAWVADLSREWGTHGDTVSRTVWFMLDRVAVPATVPPG